MNDWYGIPFRWAWTFSWARTLFGTRSDIEVLVGFRLGNVANLAFCQSTGLSLLVPFTKSFSIIYCFPFVGRAAGNNPQPLCPNGEHDSQNPASLAPAKCDPAKLAIIRAGSLSHPWLPEKDFFCFLIRNLVFRRVLGEISRIPFKALKPGKVKFHRMSF
jgi:hypothetical protein